MGTNRQIIRVAMPVTLARFRKILDAYDDDPALADAIVRHYNGSLIVEAPAELNAEATK